MTLYSRTNFPEPGTDVREWRAQLVPAIYQRDGACWVEGCPGHTFSHMHEAIRRSHVQGWKRELRVLIFTEYNCVILCDLHHNTHLEPKKEQVAEWMLETYGSAYLDWLRSLPFKIHPLGPWLSRQGGERRD